MPEILKGIGGLSEVEDSFLSFDDPVRNFINYLHFYRMPGTGDLDQGPLFGIEYRRFRRIAVDGYPDKLRGLISLSADLGRFVVEKDLVLLSVIIEEET